MDRANGQSIGGDEPILLRSDKIAARRRIVEEAIHSGEMEGLHVGVAALADADEFVAGAIDSDALVARARARYGLQ